MPEPRSRTARRPAAAPRACPRATAAPKPKREIDWAAVFGAKGLAVAGGVVTVLGIVFFFALAVNRGWVGPGARVALGSAASLLVFVAGLELRRRYGRTARRRRRGRRGHRGRLRDAARGDRAVRPASRSSGARRRGRIAAVGLGVSLAWREQLVAGIGLIGAMVAPALLGLRHAA